MEVGVQCRGERVLFVLVGVDVSVDDAREPVLADAGLLGEAALSAVAEEPDGALQRGDGRHVQDLGTNNKILQQEFASAALRGILPTVRRLDPEEVARRVSAARAYARLGRQELADALHISASTLDHIEGKRRSFRGAEWSELWAIADACGLPREWFSADFSRLAEIVSDGPTFPARSAAQEHLRNAEQAAQRRQQRSGRGRAASRDPREGAQ